MSLGHLQVFLKMRAENNLQQHYLERRELLRFRFPGTAQTYLCGQGPAICILIRSWVSLTTTNYPSVVVLRSPCPGMALFSDHTGVPDEELCPACAWPMLVPAWQLT